MPFLTLNGSGTAYSRKFILSSRVILNFDLKQRHAVLHKCIFDLKYSHSHVCAKEVDKQPMCLAVTQSAFECREILLGTVAKRVHDCQRQPGLEKRRDMRQTSTLKHFIPK